MDVPSDAHGVREIMRIVRNLRGGAQASLVIANNTSYAIKFNSNPQGENLLFNEALGSELYRILELPTAGWTPIYVDAATLDENRSIWFKLPCGSRRPS